MSMNIISNKLLNPISKNYNYKFSKTICNIILQILIKSIKIPQIIAK